LAENWEKQAIVDFQARDTSFDWSGTRQAALARSDVSPRAAAEAKMPEEPL
jgi:hypothetical protein